MRKVRIALGSNDSKRIIPGHLGMAKYFYIYDLFEDGKSDFIEKRKNTSPEEEGKHGIDKKMKACMEIFRDADVVIGRKISPNFIKMAANTKIQPVVIEIDEISDIMRKITGSFDEFNSLVEQRKKGNKPKKIPKLGEEEWDENWATAYNTAYMTLSEIANP